MMKVASFGRALAALAVLGALGLAALAAGGAFAALGGSSFTIEQNEVTIGGTRWIDFAGSATPPGLGAYTIDITYDPAVVQAVGCYTEPGLCNAEFAPDTVRFTGASLGGLKNDFSFGQIKFKATGALGDTSALRIIVQSLASDEGHDISPGEIHDGTVTIVPPHLGDADCDGDIDSVDALAVLSYLAGLSTPACLSAADVNCDGVADAKDALDIPRFVAALPILDAAPGCPPVGSET